MKTIINFRDIGGYKNKHGRTIKKGKLFRSGELYKISEEDKTKLVEDIGLKTIVDFRSSVEIKEKPDDSIDGAKHIHIDIMGDSKGRTSSFEDMLASPLTADETMFNVYDDLIATSSSLEGYRRFFNILLEENSTPLVFHCFAGKDRTGFAAAIIMEILEVPRETIYEDYLKTNEYRKEANDAERIILSKQGWSEEELDKAIEMLYVKKEYLDEGYRLLDAEYGGVKNYITEHLGLSNEDIKKFQSLYLV